ncbi:17999_t:CDS:2 [Funneliformis geosporum]|nr:17999_t:CDS:2 [Funneliformis geosporum]
MKCYKYDLKHYIFENFYKIQWNQKLKILHQIIFALNNLHIRGIIHRDFHSGNILCENEDDIVISDLGISKLITESLDNDHMCYGIIPYIAPEIFQKQNFCETLINDSNIECRSHTKASDIYSFGIIMWELMAGRRPFWDQNYDTDLIIKICDGIRPPIVTNAPEGFINIMQECWNANPNKRPTASYIFDVIDKIYLNEEDNPTKITKSPEIGPIVTNNPVTHYESSVITNTESTSSSQGQSIFGKRKYRENFIDDDKNNKKIKPNESHSYLSNALEFDI